MIKQKKKICLGCNTPQYIFSWGKCKTCYNKEYKKPIKKISEKGLKKKKLKTENTKLVHQVMYNWWLKQSKNECMSCGCKLPKEFHTWMVDHLLEKSNYEEFDKDERNFFLCCLDCHTLKGNGFPTEKHKKAIQKAKYLLLHNVEFY